jgi:hypothetical protein
MRGSSTEEVILNQSCALCNIGLGKSKVIYRDPNDKDQAGTGRIVRHGSFKHIYQPIEFIMPITLKKELKGWYYNDDFTNEQINTFRRVGYAIHRYVFERLDVIRGDLLKEDTFLREKAVCTKFDVFQKQRDMLNVVNYREKIVLEKGKTYLFDEDCLAIVKQWIMEQKGEDYE